MYIHIYMCVSVVYLLSSEALPSLVGAPDPGARPVALAGPATQRSAAV